MTNMKERRTEPRLPWSATITIRKDGQARTVTTTARLRNISPSGFAFISEDMVTKGQTYDFHLNMMTIEVDLTARIVHMRIEPPFYVCGVRYENLKMWQRRRLLHFLATRSERLRKRILMRAAMGGAAAATVGLIAGMGVAPAVSLGVGAGFLAWFFVLF